jgi:fructokinase
MQENETRSTNSEVLVFGEILYDCFPSGEEVLGGAPFNVAWHLQAFGLQPLMISRLGRDTPGDQAQAVMQEWGMTVAGIQRDDEHPTGRVHVTLDAGQPKFEIAHPAAYDFITAERLPAHVHNDAGLLYHGSLALREDVSREAWLRTVSAFRGSVFFDVNLRDPWWTAQRLCVCLEHTHWLKLNDDEWAVLIREVMDRDPEGMDAGAFFERWPLKGIFVTHGAGGASLILRGGEVYKAEPEPIDRIEDTVGAGDGFTSVCLCGLLNHWPPETYLRRAVRFASDICRQQGAIRRNRSLYQRHINSWMEHA